MTKVSACSSEVSEKSVKNFTKFLIALIANSAEVIKKFINTLSKLLISDQITMKTSVLSQAFELPAAIMNVSEKVMHHKLHIKLFILKNLTFVKFSTIINVNHMKDL